MRPPIRHLLVLVAVTLAIGACNDAAAETTTTASTNVEFGSGEIPDTVPDDFPVMQGSVISSTLVNRDNGFTEMIIRMPEQLGVAVQYYTQELTLAGYEIDSSAADSDTTWDIVADGSGIDLEIRLRMVQPEVTEAAIRIQPQS